MQQTLKTGERSSYTASRRELEPLGGIVPTSDPYYSEEINSPEYNYGGDIFRPEFGCTLPETGQPAPCNVAAALMNYIGRVNRAFDPGYNQPARAGRTIPDFIRADNRRDDEYERIPGLRLAPQYNGREYVGSVWREENSTAAQQSPYTNDNKEIRNAIKDADTILSENNDCSEFFGKYAKKALLFLDDLLLKDSLEKDNNETGIRQILEGSKDVLGNFITSTKDTKIQIQEKAFRLSKSAIVNSNGPFFNFKSPSRIGNYAPISRESRVLQILHELAHLIYKPDGKGGYETLIPDDVGSGLVGQSTKNTQTVKDACEDEINNLGKKKEKKKK